jgi:CheY-like chemotaxis protein
MPKVLVVDDSLTVRKVVERALEARSIQVLAAASGAEALASLEREAPDLVICDVIMPDQDGFAICEFVKGHASLGRTPVLLISGVVNGNVLERAAAVRSDGIMRKPFAAEELVRKIDGLLSGDRNGSRAPAAPAPPAPGATVHDPFREPPAAEPAPDLKSCLEQVATLPGVALAAVVDREGFLVEGAGDRPLEGEVAWAWASALAEASDGMGRELGQGALHAVILEYEAGVVLLNAVGPAALLAVVLRDPTVLGKVRYSLKRTLPELLRAL